MGRENFLGGTRIQNTQEQGGWQAQRHWTHFQARACRLHFYHSLCQFSFVPKRKKAKAYLYGWNESCWHYRKKQFQVYEPSVEDILVGVMLWGECSPRCSKICSCLSLEMTTRKGRKRGKGTVKFRKQTLSSLNRTHSFFQYQELITACLPFLGKVFTGFWKRWD